LAFPIAPLIIAGLLVALPAQAQLDISRVESEAQANGLKVYCGSGSQWSRCVLEIILKVVNFLLILVASLALAGIVYGGLMYILSLGDESKASRGKQAILYSIVGLIIAGIAGLILLVVQTIIS